MSPLSLDIVSFDVGRKDFDLIFLQKKKMHQQQFHSVFNAFHFHFKNGDVCNYLGPMLWSKNIFADFRHSKYIG
jgi:hypothetical protein